MASVRVKKIEFSHMLASSLDRCGLDGQVYFDDMLSGDSTWNVCKKIATDKHGNLIAADSCRKIIAAAKFSNGDINRFRWKLRLISFKQDLPKLSWKFVAASVLLLVVLYFVNPWGNLLEPREDDPLPSSGNPPAQADTTADSTSEVAFEEGITGSQLASSGQDSTQASGDEPQELKPDSASKEAGVNPENVVGFLQKKKNKWELIIDERSYSNTAEMAIEREAIKLPGALVMALVMMTESDTLTINQVDGELSADFTRISSDIHDGLKDYFLNKLNSNQLHKSEYEKVTIKITVSGKKSADLREVTFSITKEEKEGT